MRPPGPISPSRVETLSNGPAADPLFCDLPANLHLHLEHDVDLERLSGLGRPGHYQHALPSLGRSGVLHVLRTATHRPGGAEADRRLRQLRARVIADSQNDALYDKHSMAARPNLAFMSLESHHRPPGRCAAYRLLCCVRRPDRSHQRLRRKVGPTLGASGMFWPNPCQPDGLENR